MIKGLKISAGMYVHINPGAVHMDAELWGPEPVTEYHPDRYSDSIWKCFTRCFLKIHTLKLLRFSTPNFFHIMLMLCCRHWRQESGKMGNDFYYVLHSKVSPLLLFSE